MIKTFLLLNLNLRTFSSLVKLELKKLLTYQFEFWISSFIYIPLHTFATYYIWKAAVNDISCFGEYCFSASQVVAFFLLTGFINRIQLRSDDMTTMFLIFNGQISKMLCYPIAYWHFIASKTLVNMIYQCVILGFILLSYSLLISKINLLGLNFVGLVQSLSLITLAIIISKLGVTIINSSAFWIDRCGPILFSYMRIQTLLGGSLVPVFMMPSEIAPFIKILPFYNMVEVPALLILRGPDFNIWLNSFLILSLWLVVYLLACQKIWKRGLKNYSAVGM